MGHAQDYFVDRLVYCNSNNLMTFAWLVFVPFSEAARLPRWGGEATNSKQYAVAVDMFRSNYRMNIVKQTTLQWIR